MSEDTQQTKPIHYRILGLKVENMMRVKCVHVLPSGNVIKIGGKNDSGKTSLLNSIDLACRGGSGSVCEQPVRQGAFEGNVDIDLGDILVHKRFKINGSPVLKVSMKDGTPVKSPQAILDALCSKITFDPLSWMNMEPPKQKDLLAKLVGVDLERLKLKRAKLYDERTLTNRDLAQKRAKLATMVPVTDAPAEEVSVGSVMESLNALRKRNADKSTTRETCRLNQVALESDTKEWNALGVEITRLESELNAKKKTHAEMGGEISNDNLALTKLKEAVAALVDESEQPLLDEINGLDQKNAKVRDAAARKAVVAEVDHLSTKEVQQTSAIEALDAEKEELLKNAKFPLEGLSFDDSGVLLSGLPFEQAGTATKLRASIAIGLALNPKLRVVLIRNGDQLDDDSMAVLTEMADKMDCQIWVEICRDLDRASVIIEDGLVKEV